MVTADDIKVGLAAFCYYSMRPGVVASMPDTREGWDGWFRFRYTDDEGGTDLLNAERLCTFEHAKRMGWWEG